MVSKACRRRSAAGQHGRRGRGAGRRGRRGRGEAAGVWLANYITTLPRGAGAVRTPGGTPARRRHTHDASPGGTRVRREATSGVLFSNKLSLQAENMLSSHRASYRIHDRIHVRRCSLKFYPPSAAASHHNSPPDPQPGKKAARRYPSAVAIPFASRLLVREVQLQSFCGGDDTTPPPTAPCTRHLMPARRGGAPA